MPTVIDELIIQLGLDPSKFNKGQKEALNSFKKTGEEAKKLGGSIEDAGKGSAETLGLLRNKLAAVGAVLATLGIGKLAAEITRQDAATARLTYTLGTNVTTLDKWRNAAYLVGGSADGMTNSIQGLVNEFQNFSITGESSLIPWFRALNVEISDQKTGKMRDFDAIMHDLANAFQKLDPVKAAAFGKALGLDQGTINLLIKGGDELDKVLRTAEKYGNLTAQQAENATKLAGAMAQVNLAYTEWARTIMNSVTPALIKMSEWTSKALSDRGNINDKSIFGRALNYMGLGKKKAESTSGSGAFSSNAEKEAFIRAEAAKRGISPDVAMAVARSEGFDSYVGDQGTSFGAYQLHYKNNIPGLSLGGLGDEFTKKTGLHASDRSTEREQIKFALDEAAKGGWGPWHGWKGSQWAGIDRSANGGKSEVKINTINIQTQATDANGIAATIGPAIQRNGLATQAQGGLQ